MPRSLAVLVLVLAVALTGCTPAEPDPVQAPSPTAEPLFASDDEALAAAEETLTGYWSQVNQSMQDGTSDTTGVASYVTTSFLESENGGVSTVFSENGWHQEGAVTIAAVEFQQQFVSDTSITVIVTACSDYSTRTVIDKEGQSLSFNVANRKLFEVTLDRDRIRPNSRLLISKYEEWADKSC